MPNLAKSKLKGLFLVFEGGEGTGKSTQIQKLKSKLEDQGSKVIVTFEPGGTVLGQKIREILLNPAHSGMSPKAEALLLAASRAQHVEEVIRPGLESGAVVLSDRYWDASLAYQGVARNLGVQNILDMNLWATSGLAPDKVFIFDLEPGVGMERARARAQGEALDRLEQEDGVFHQRVRQGYLTILARNPGTHTLVDASLNVGDISNILWSHIQPLLSQRTLIA
jgi:dTMP kinase